MANDPFVPKRAYQRRAAWWATRDSNPDELPHTPLKRARLPVPPAAQLSRLILAKANSLAPAVEGSAPCGQWERCGKSAR